jgi:hypothetical protein
MPNVLTRTIGRGSAKRGSSEKAQFLAEAGDSLVLVSKSNFGGPCVSPSEIARLVGEDSSPAELADRIAGVGYTDEGTPFAAVAVIRID